MPKPNRSHALRKRSAFLNALAEGVTISAAAKAAGIGLSTVYSWRESDEAFAADWQEAYRQGANVLEAEARRRAVNGTRKYLYHQGRPILDPRTGEHAYEMNYSDLLLIVLLKARDPETYCERVRLAAILRQWAKEDAANGSSGTVPADSVIELLQQVASKKAALALTDASAAPPVAV